MRSICFAMTCISPGITAIRFRRRVIRSRRQRSPMCARPPLRGFNSLRPPLPCNGPYRCSAFPAETPFRPVFRRQPVARRRGPTSWWCAGRARCRRQAASPQARSTFKPRAARRISTNTRTSSSTLARMPPISPERKRIARRRPTSTSSKPGSTTCRTRRSRRCACSRFRGLHRRTSRWSRESRICACNSDATTSATMARRTRSASASQRSIRASRPTGQT